MDAVYAFAHALHKLHSDVCLNRGNGKNGKNKRRKVALNWHNKTISKRFKQTGEYSLLLKRNNDGALGERFDNEEELDADLDDGIEEEPIKYVCPQMANYDGKDFYNNYLLNVSFIGKSFFIIRHFFFYFFFTILRHLFLLFTFSVIITFFFNEFGSFSYD